MRKKLKKQFGRQLECIVTEAVDEETGETFAMVLLRPTLEAKCFVEARRVKSTKQGGRIEDHITYGRSGAPQTYCLSAKKLGKADIALVANAPEPVLAVSERFRDAMLATIPRRVRHLKHIEFRNYCMLDERAESTKRKVSPRSARKKTSKREMGDS